MSSWTSEKCKYSCKMVANGPPCAFDKAAVAKAPTLLTIATTTTTTTTTTISNAHPRLDNNSQLFDAYVLHLLGLPARPLTGVAQPTPPNRSC
jgi:hypothetical protein